MFKPTLRQALFALLCLVLATLLFGGPEMRYIAAGVTGFLSWIGIMISCSDPDNEFRDEPWSVWTLSNRAVALAVGVLLVIDDQVYVALALFVWVLFAAFEEARSKRKKRREYGHLA